VEAPIQAFEQSVAGLLATSRQETTDALCRLPELTSRFEAARTNLQSRVERAEARARARRAEPEVVAELLAVPVEEEDSICVEFETLRRAALLLLGLAIGSFGLGFLLGSH